MTHTKKKKTTFIKELSKKNCSGTKEGQRRRSRGGGGENTNKGVESLAVRSWGEIQISDVHGVITGSEFMTWQQKSSTSQWTGDQSRLSSRWTALHRMSKVGADNLLQIWTLLVFIWTVFPIQCSHIHINMCIVSKLSCLYHKVHLPNFSCLPWFYTCWLKLNIM